MEKIKLIVADDHPVFRGGMEGVLKSMTFISKVSQAANGEEVIRLLEHENYDLVLMDIRMSPVSGIEATGIIRDRFPKTKVIALSMHDDETNIMDILEKGASGYLIKNAGKDDIIEAIQDVMAGKEYFSKEASRVIYQRLVRNSENLLQKRELESLNSGRLREVIFLICHELTTQQIADALCLSKRTIEEYRKTIADMTKSKSIVGVVKYALGCGIMDDELLQKKFGKWVKKDGIS